jgi:hypothetical protein
MDARSSQSPASVATAIIGTDFYSFIRWRGQCMAPWASPENAHIA